MGFYPFEGECSYVRNAWYVVALRTEVTREPMERMVMDDPILLYRTRGGDAVALYGLCPHRYYPLALGRVIEDEIECGYHGMRFDCSGACTSVPSREGRAASFDQRVYPVVEHGPWVWIWPGDVERADTSALPDVGLFGYSRDGAPLEGWACHAALAKHTKSRSQLIVENVLDLTHVSYLHQTILDMDVFLSAKMSYHDLPHGGLRIDREIRDAPWNTYFDFYIGAEHRFAETADYTSHTYFFGPGLIVTGGNDVQRIKGLDAIPTAFGSVHVQHAATPETRHSTHYFWGVTRNVRVGDDAFHQLAAQSSSDVIDQDVAALEAIERHVDRAYALRRELLVPADTAAGKIRQKMQRWIDMEAPVSSAANAAA